MQEKHRSATVLKELLLDLHHHRARLAWLIQKKKVRTKTENSSEVGLFVTH